MKSDQLLFNAAFMIACLTACNEKNPYTEDMKRSEAASTPEQTVNNGANRSDLGQSNGNGSNTGTDQAVIEDQPTEAAEEGDIEATKLTSVEIICNQEGLVTQYPVEMGYLCLDGQATQTMADLLANPYQGDAQGPARILKADDVNGISHLISASSLRINRPINEVFDRRSAMNSFTVEQGNARYTIQQANTIPAATGTLGGFEVTTALNVTVGIIQVNDTALQVRELRDISGDMSVIADVAKLKPNDPANQAAILSNLVSFWIADEASTTMIVITHQQVNNRGQAQRAADTFASIGLAIDRQVFNIVSN